MSELAVGPVNRYVFLTSFQVLLLLLIQELHFENHSCGVQGDTIQLLKNNFSMCAGVLDLKHISGRNSTVQRRVCLQQNVEFPSNKSAWNAGDAPGAIGSIPRLGRFPGKGNGNPLQYSCLENPIDRGLVGYSPLGLKTVGHH